jgi:hypothetical protein
VRLTPWQQLAGAVVAACAITYGCSADNVAAVLPTAAGTQAASTSGAPSDAPQIAGNNPGEGPSIITPLALSDSAQFGGRGKEDDLISGNRIADALYGSLGGGALEAADGEGGAIDDPDLAIGSAFNSKAQSAWLLPLALSTLSADIGATEIQPDGNTAVWIRSLGGLEARVSGVSAITSPTTTGMPDLVDGYRITSGVRVLGTLGFGNRPELDLRFTGIGGIVGRNDDGSHAIDLTVAAPGISIQGLILGFRVDATLTGVHGRFTDVAKLNKRLFTEPLQLHLNQVSARDVVTALRGQAVLHSVKLPERTGQWVKFAISGNLDATLDKRHALARTGRVARVTAEVTKADYLTFDGLTGPLEGVSQVTFINAAGTVKDRLTYTYRSGALHIAGNRTNVTGEQERVTSTGDTRRAQGNVRFNDGSRSEHVVEVRRSDRGRRVTVRFLVKDAKGTHLVSGDGVVHADRSLSGKWTRPAPGGASGTWRLLPDGELELNGPDGDLIVRAKVREGWSELLY